MPEINQQLSLRFAGDDRLSDKMKIGQFLYFIELNTPPLAQPYDSAIALTINQAKEFNKIPEVTAISITDRLLTEKCHDPVETATRISKVIDKPIIMALSGKGSSFERIKTHLATAKSNGINNILAVTGNVSDLHPYNAFSKLREYENGYFDSIDILHMARKIDKDFKLGAVVSPYQYTPEGQCLQYAKMMKKIACGAQFIVTQSGWDMKKAQELLWFLQRRQQSISVFARIPLIHLDEAKKLADGYQEGIYIPIPIATKIMQMARQDLDTFLDFQIDRIALQVIGYRTLGFSGIQFTGVRNPSILKKIMDKIHELEKIYPDYNSWLQEWNNNYNLTNFAPLVAPHYLFKNLLQKDICEYKEKTAIIAGTALPGPRVFDVLRNFVISLAFSKRMPHFVRNFVSYLYRYSPQKMAKLAPCLYLNHRICPKRLVHGPCGSTQPNGFCECEDRTCFFHRVLHLAAFKKDFSLLEKDDYDSTKSSN
ncbi:MAG: methylenetetrahydrofolate reductase C-terminal domain-containing protein [Lentisphaeria bacterium]